MLLAGDLVDKSNALFEAYGILAKGVQSLLAAGIPVIAIAGNHDFEALPRLAAELDGFTLLGASGDWEEALIENRSQTNRLRVQGVSFTSSEWNTNPLTHYTAPDDAIPTIALLHCDLDTTTSKYAPVTRSDLIMQHPSAWLLGHIHKPQILSTQPLILYPGSPQGLDPGEPGAHGGTLITLDQNNAVQATPVEFAGLRYESIAVDISEATTVEGVRALLIPELRQWHERETRNTSFLRFVSLRLSLQGACDLSRNELAALQLELEQDTLEIGETRYLFEQVRLETRPRIDLATLSGRDDPPSLLARRIEMLQTKSPPDQYQELIATASGRLEAITQQQQFQVLGIEELEEECVRQDLLSAAWALLDDLLKQQSAPVLQNPSSNQAADQSTEETR